MIRLRYFHDYNCGESVPFLPDMGKNKLVVVFIIYKVMKYRELLMK